MTQSAPAEPSDEQIFAAAKHLSRQREFARAIALGEALRARWHDLPELHSFLAVNHAGLGRPRAALEHLEKAAEMTGEGQLPFAHVNDIVRLMWLTGQKERIPAFLERYMPLSGRPSGRQWMVFALPKSAGSSLSSSLADALGVPHYPSGYESPKMPYQAAVLLAPEMTRRLGARSCIHQTHAMPWRRNIAVLRSTARPRFLIHLRDPRDAVLSYYHMGERYAMHRMRFVLAFPGYNAWPQERRFEAVLKVAFPTFVGWIRGWLDYADSHRDQAMVTSFDDLTREGPALVERITAFLTGTSRSCTDLHKVHFRVGQDGGDDPLMPATLRRRLHSAIPADMRARFGWLP